MESVMKCGWLAFAGTLCAVAQSSPTVLTYVTYLPAAAANHIAVDSAGFAYVSGVYYDQHSPCTWSLTPPNPDGSFSFVTKLQPRGNGAVWVACVRGASVGVAVDTGGFVYVAITANNATTVIKFSQVDGRIAYSTQIASATASAIAVDTAGNAYLTGAAIDGLPTTPGAYQKGISCSATNSPCADAFAVKLGATGAIQYATYLHTSGGGNAIAIDSRAQVWITGTSGAHYGFTDSFIVKLDSSGGSRLVNTGAYGALVYHHATSAGGLGIAVDSKDAAYAVGFTEYEISTTPGTIYPGRAGYYTPLPFITKLDSAGNTVYATYLDKTDSPATSIAVDAQGNAYIGLGQQDGHAPCAVAQSKLIVLNANASKVLNSVPFRAWIGTFALDARGSAFIAGTTITTAFLTTPGAYVTQYPGGFNAAFAAKLDLSKPTTPRLDCVVNAASLGAGRNGVGINGSVAPGEIVSLFGAGFEPGSELGVTFDGKPAPILYADTGQINAVVPFQVGSGNPVTVVSVNQGSQSVGGFELPVAPASPGLFTVGDGQLYALNGIYGAHIAALNQDGTVNSSSNPAAPGSVVSLFITGAGAYNMVINDGDPGPLVPPFPAPMLSVSAVVWSPFVSPSFPGQPQLADILFVGQAPGLVAGVVQVNLRIPENAQPGKAGIVVYVGNYASSFIQNVIEIR